MTVAYDYSAQRWVEGSEAEILLSEQRAEHETLMANPEYRKMLGIPDPE